MTRVRLARAGSALAVMIAGIGLSMSLTAVPASAATLNAPSITSPTSGNEPTPTVTVSGTADPSADVVVLDGGSAVAATTSDGSGNWSVPVMLLAGAHTLTAIEVDSTGDKSAPSSSVAVDVTSNQVVADGNFSEGGAVANNGFDNAYLPPDGTNPSPGTPGYWFPTNNCPSGPGYIEWNNDGNGAIGSYQPYDNTEYDNSYPGSSPGPSSNYVELNSNCVNGVTQTIETVPGDQYTVSFGYAARGSADSTCEYNTFELDWGSSGNQSTVASDLCAPSTTWETATYTVTATSAQTVLSFVDQDTTLSDTLGGELSTVSVVPTASLAPPNTSWDTAAAVGSYPNGQSIDFSGESLWYKFPVVPDEQLTVTLSGASAGEQLALYSDIGQAVASESSSGTANLPAIEAENPGNNAAWFNESPFNESPFNESPFNESPFNESPFNESPFNESPFNESPYLGSWFNESPFVEAESESLLGESSPAGAATQTFSANTWNNVGTGNTGAYYYVEVFGNNGAFSTTGNPFTVTLETSGTACAGLNNFSTDVFTQATSGFSSPAGGNLDGVGTDYSTVIVDDSAAMPSVSSILGEPNDPAGASAGTLYNLAQATNGVVVDVGQSKGVQELATQAASSKYTGCPYAVDLEADAIQSIINSYRTQTTTDGGSNVKDVVIVGDDDVIPFFRYADEEGIGPESTYSPPLSSASEAEAALASNYYLSDDQYGAATELSVDGTTLPVENAAVGRLVETPSEISTTISNYLTLPNHTIVPKSTLATGYSFMAPPAQSVASAFAAGTPAGTTADPSGTNDTLIGDSWSAAQLSTALTTTAHQLVFLGAHFNASGLEAADGSALWTPQFAGSIGTNLDDSLVISAGCHSGYTIDPADAVSFGNPPTYVTGLPSWPEAFASAGATLIAGTGYQFGDSNYTADSDQFYVDLANQLGYGTQSVGSALLSSDYKYLAGLDQLNGLNEKSLLEITLYGLPMLNIAETHQGAPPAADSSIVGGSLDPAGAVPSSSGPGSQLGLDEAMVDVPTAQLTEHSVAGSGLTYYSGPQGVTADPGQAVVPVQTEDVNGPANYVLRGVGFLGGSYTDTSGQTPLTGDPVTDTSEPASPFSSSTFYPEKIWNPNYFGTIETGSDTELGITPLQYVTDPADPSTAIMRTYADTHLDLFYSNDADLTAGANSAALSSAPGISGVSVTVNGDQVTVTATVIGDLAAGIQKVWTTYTDPGYDACGSGTTATPCWQSVDMTASSTSPNVYSATFTTSDANIATAGDFIVQAANGVGEVSLDDNGGNYFSAGASNQSEASPNTYSLSFASGQASSGDYQSSLGVSATLSELTGTGNVAGVPVTFRLGSRQVTAWTDSAGTATATIPLTDSPGGYTLTASYAGDAEDVGAAASMPFTITKPETTLVLSTSSNFTSGGSFEATLTSGGAPVAQKTVIFDVTNSTGTIVASGTGLTDMNGVATSQPIDLPVDDTGSGYSVTAYFGEQGTPVPGVAGANATYDATDLQYGGSSSNPVSLEVSDATQTALQVSPSPAKFGTPLTLTVTVAPAATQTSAWPTANGAAVPTGNVTIEEGGTTLGTPSLSFDPSTGMDTATITVRGVTVGTHTFTASYAGNPSAFLDASQGSITEVVGFTETISGTYSGPLRIKSGQAVLVTGQVSGAVTVDAGGALEVLGGSVGGPIRASGPDGFTLCGATVSGPVSVSSSAADVYIGGTSTGITCNPSTISGPVSLSSNSGNVTIATSNVSGPVELSSNSGDVTLATSNVSGPVSVSGNTGPVTELAGNTIDGPLSCSGNVPPPGDNSQPNSAPVESGQCAGPGF